MTTRFGFSLQGRGVLADRDAITTLALRAETLGFDSVFVLIILIPMLVALAPIIMFPGAILALPRLLMPKFV